MMAAAIDQRVKIPPGVGLELSLAARAAKQKGLALMRQAMWRIPVREHTADGVNRTRAVPLRGASIRGSHQTLLHGRPCAGSAGNIPYWGIQYTWKGYHDKPMDPGTAKKTLTALKRIEGQVRGVGKMVEDGRYCIDIVTQVEAARAALAKVEADLLRQHLSHCVAKAMKAPDPGEQERVIEELIGVFRR